MFLCFHANKWWCRDDDNDDDDEDDEVAAVLIAKGRIAAIQDIHRTPDISYTLDWTGRCPQIAPFLAGSDRSLFSRLIAHGYDQQRDTQTHTQHGISVTIGRILYTTAMQPNKGV